MGLIDVGVQNEILPYVVATVVAGFLIAITKSLIMSWFKDKERNEKRSVWIKFLKSDIIINKCILAFEEIVNLDAELTIILGGFGMFLGFFSTVILLVIIVYFFRNNSFAVPLLALINIIPYMLSIVLEKYVYKIKKEGTLFKKSKSIICYSKIINWSIYGTGTTTILFIYSIYINPSQISSSDESMNALGALIFSIMFIITSLHFLNITVRRKFFDSLKSKLNTEYGKRFPYIHITTKAGGIDGKIQDVFDKDIIILDDSGLKAVVEWDEITTLKLQDKGGTPTDLSYYK